MAPAAPRSWASPGRNRGHSVSISTGQRRSTHPPDSPAVLAAALVATGRGEVAAFEQLYRATVERVLATARSVVIDPGQAEEVVQETYLEIWRCADRFDPTRGPALPWLLRIVRHRAIDRVRHCESARARERAFVRDAAHAEPDEPVLERILRFEGARELHAAIGRLTERQREALWLTYFDHCTGPQLSARLGLPLGTVKARLRDGVSGLRTLVSGTG